MKVTRGRVFATIAVFLLSIAAVGVVAYVELPLATPEVNLQINNAGDILQNITVSCDGCVPNGGTNHTWAGNLYVDGAKLDISVNVSGSTAIQAGLYLGYSYLLSTNPSCPESGYRSATMCFVTFSNDTLPFVLGLDIHQTSSGGVLKVKVFQWNGNSIDFQSSTGQLSENFNEQSANGYEPV